MCIVFVAQESSYCRYQPALSNRFTLKRLEQVYDILKLNEAPEILVFEDLGVSDLVFWESEQILREERFLKTKLIVLTKSTDPARFLRWYDAGAVDCLKHESDPRELAAKIGAFSRLVPYIQRNKHENKEGVMQRKKLLELYPVVSRMKEILYIKADSPYCKVVLSREEKGKAVFDTICLRTTLKKILQLDVENNLAQIHRSILVSRHKVVGMKRAGTRSKKVLLESPDQKPLVFPIGRSYSTSILPLNSNRLRMLKTRAS